MTVKEYEEMEFNMSASISVLTMALIIISIIIGSGTLFVIASAAFIIGFLVSPIIVELYDIYKSKNEKA